MMLTLQIILVTDFIVNHNALSRLTNMVSPIFYSMVVMVWDMLINYSEMLLIVIFLSLSCRCGEHGSHNIWMYKNRNNNEKRSYKNASCQMVRVQ